MEPSFVETAVETAQRFYAARRGAGAARLVFKLSAKRRDAGFARVIATFTGLEPFSKTSPSIKMETSVLRMEDEEP